MTTVVFAVGRVALRGHNKHINAIKIKKILAYKNTTICKIKLIVEQLYWYRNNDK